MLDPRSTGADREAAPLYAVTGQCYEKYRQRLLYLCLRKVESRARAEEIVQESFLALARAEQAGRIGEMGNVPAYLVGIANKLILRHYRDRPGQREAALDSGVGAIPGTVPDAERSAQAREDLTILRESLRGMKPRDRAVARLIFVEGRSTVEACRSLGVTPNYLKVLLHRIRKRMRRDLSRAHTAPEGAARVTGGAHRELCQGKE